MSSVAVVILNFNGKELLEKFIPSVIQFSSNAKIIVADNNSSDGSKEFITQKFPQVGIISMASNLGFCGGYNFALKQVKSDYYVLLNSDVEVTPNWLTPILEMLDSDKSIGAVQPKILSYFEKNKFEYAGAAGGFIDVLGYPFCRGRIFSTTEEDQGQYDQSIPIFWATGACLIIRSELYHSLDGLDETFFAHMEEIDLCWRLKRAGYGIMCCGASHVYHVGGATLDKSNPRKTYYNFRNGFILLIKNLKAHQLWYKLPLRMLLDWVAAVQFLLSGKVGDFLAVVRAHFYIISRCVTLFRKRTNSLPYNINLIYTKSIVFAYYLKGLKRFSDLTFNNPK